MMFQGGCVKENFDTVPNLVDSSLRVKTVSIADIKALLTNPSNIAKVKKLATTATWQKVTDAGVTDSSIVFEGYVTSNDSTGNFYEVVTIQDNSGGIDIKINLADLYNQYRLKPGQKVKVKANDLYLGNYRGVYQLGAAIVELGSLKIIGMPPSMISKTIERSGARKALIPDTLTISQINDSYVQKLVCIKDVQFKDPFNGFSIPGVNTNRTLTDCSGNNTLILRTSGFASFSQEQVPSGKGTITGVLSTYDATKQLYIRDLNDIKFTEPRCGSSAPTPNTTIAALKAMCTSNLVNITSDIIVTGTITANDESGNVYKQLFIQDESSAIEIKVDIAGLYAEYPVGTKIVINCKNLYLGKYHGVIQLGGIYNSAIGRLAASDFYSKFFIVGSGNAVTPVAVSVANLSDALIGKLILIDNVQFINSDLGKAWTDPGATSNRYLEDLTGNRLIVRSSSFANFANNLLPNGNGEISAILTKYDSDYQLTLRSLSDVKFNKSRFKFALAQDFSSAALGSPITNGGWQTIASAGTRVWLGKSSTLNGVVQYYAEMNPNNSSEASNVAWLISPQVNLAGLTGKVLFFQTAYNNWVSGATLEALISTNFDGTNVAAANWVPLADALIVKQTDAANTWINSGNIDLTQYTGNIYIGFRYTSTGGGSATAFRVDNVKIISN